MNFEEIVKRLNVLLEAGRKPELRGALSMLNVVDIAEYIAGLPHDKALVVFCLLPKDMSADVFSYLDNDSQSKIIEALDDVDAVHLLDRMFIDDAVDFLGEMPASVVRRMLAACTPERRALLNQFLHYPENSAGSLMTVEYMELYAGITVKDALVAIRTRGIDKEIINTVYILDEDRKLIGTVGLRKLLLSDDARTVDEVMNVQPIFVQTTDDQEHVADTVRKYDLLSIPVVDHESHMVGIVTADDIMDVIEEENTEDFEKMAALLPSEDTYLKTPVIDLAKNRLPWLLILMVSATFTGQIIAHFESVISLADGIGVALTACIPMLMDTGGNCGAQASTLAIRGLALGEISIRDLLKVLWKEVRIAILLGSVLALVNFYRIAWFTDYSSQIAYVVSTAMFCTVIIAKSIGCTLPLLAKAIRLDPALMASPLITTMVDAGSLFILFTIASRAMNLG